MLDDPDVWRDVDAHSRHGRTRQSSRLTIVETVETHEDSRDERMCAESRGVRPPRTVAPVGRVRTPLTFGGSGVYINISHARPGMHNPMQIAQQRFGYTYRHSCSAGSPACSVDVIKPAGPAVPPAPHIWVLAHHGHGARATCHCQRATCKTNTERITVLIISDVLTQGPSATRAALITRATTSARASA